MGIDITYKDMTEGYVSFEVASLLKEKGFELEDCFAFYKSNGEIGFLQTFGDITDYENDTCIAAPTLQEAMDWLRKEKELLISINPALDKDNYLCIVYYIWDLNDIDKDAIKSGPFSVENYNECVEKAINYCLDNLI